MTLLQEMDRKIPQTQAADEAELTFRVAKPEVPDACIKVIGVGGGGCNAAQRMAAVGIDQVEIISVNTDVQDLRGCADVGQCIQIGHEISKGLGAGMDPDMGQSAAEESLQVLESLVQDANMVFLTAGMGGGTGTGAIPVIAALAQKHEVLTVAVVTRPFGFEGKRRSQIAEEGLQQLSQHVDALIVIPNDKLLPDEGEDDVRLDDAFMETNNVLHSAVRGISDLITRPGQINVDFSDVSTIMRGQGPAVMGTGSATGENRAEEAAHEAINNRLLEDIRITNANGILVNITTNGSLRIGEKKRIADMIQQMTQDDTKIVLGTAIDSKMSDDSLEVTMVVAGFESARPSAWSRTTGSDTVVQLHGHSGKSADTVIPRTLTTKKPKEASEATEATAEVTEQHEQQEQPKVAVSGGECHTEGATALAPDHPNGEGTEPRERFNIPKYLDRQGERAGRFVDR